jgi:hypothetical protein
MASIWEALDWPVAEQLNFKCAFTRSTFLLEALVGAGCPEGVDLANKEIFLDDAKFQELFGMDKEAWKGVAGWKKSSEKKKHGLCS